MVDTHVQRISQRLGWTKNTEPETIEQDLCALLPREDWDPAEPHADLPRPAHLLRAQAELRRVRRERRVPERVQGGERRAQGAAAAGATQGRRPRARLSGVTIRANANASPRVGHRGNARRDAPSRCTDRRVSLSTSRNVAFISSAKSLRGRVDERLAERLAQLLGEPIAPSRAAGLGPLEPRAVRIEPANELGDPLPARRDAPHDRRRPQLARRVRAAGEPGGLAVDHVPAPLPHAIIVSLPSAIISSMSRTVASAPSRSALFTAKTSAALQDTGLDAPARRPPSPAPSRRAWCAPCA